MSRVHAFVDDALGDLDAVALADAIRSGRVGRADVVEAAIARAEAVNPALNALAYAAFDVARDAAAMGTGQEAFFSGVPTFIKDNVDVAGQPSMHGTDAWEPYAAVADSEITRVVLGTGLVSLGKTQLSEFGFSAVAEHPRLGPVRNPWNTDYTAGASSSGSGALVAAGVVPIAHANDGGGSIRIPAACNGLVGLKPSRGRLPLEPEYRRLPVGGYEGARGRAGREMSESATAGARSSRIPFGIIRNHEAVRPRRSRHLNHARDTPQMVAVAQVWREVVQATAIAIAPPLPVVSWGLISLAFLSHTVRGRYRRSPPAESGHHSNRRQAK